MAKQRTGVWQIPHDELSYQFTRLVIALITLGFDEDYQTKNRFVYKPGLFWAVYRAIQDGSLPMWVQARIQIYDRGGFIECEELANGLVSAAFSRIISRPFGLTMCFALTVADALDITKALGVSHADAKSWATLIRQYHDEVCRSPAAA